MKRAQRVYREKLGDEILRSSDFMFDKQLSELTFSESLLIYSLRKEMRSNNNLVDRYYKISERQLSETEIRELKET